MSGSVHGYEIHNTKQHEQNRDYMNYFKIYVSQKKKKLYYINWMRSMCCAKAY